MHAVGRRFQERLVLSVLMLLLSSVGFAAVPTHAAAGRPAAAVVAVTDSASPTPSASQSGCLGGRMYSFWLDPMQISRGDTSTANIRWQEHYGCGPPEGAEEEPYGFDLYAEALSGPDAGQAPVLIASGVTGDLGWAHVVVSPQVTTHYSVRFRRPEDPVDSGPQPSGYRGGPSDNETVAVNFCPVDLTVPSSTPAGQTVRVVGRAQGSDAVSMLFHRRGINGYVVRRSLSPDGDGRFSTTYVADDDYRLMARTACGDSAIVTSILTPTIHGPARAARGSQVPISVRAGANVPVAIYFHRAGTTGYTIGRTGSTDASGRFVVSYRATADQRYYVVSAPGARRSAPGLTQIG